MKPTCVRGRAAVRSMIEAGDAAAVLTAMSSGDRAWLAAQQPVLRPVTDWVVRQVTPVAVAEDGRNFFRVEARLDATPGGAQALTRLRPGMEGIGKIEVNQRRLISIYTRDLVNWARLWIWTWWPGA